VRKKIGAVLFDKDGTLVDFGDTWNTAVGHALGKVDDIAARREAAGILGYNLDTRIIEPTSLFVAETLDDTISRLGQVIDAPQFAHDLNHAAASTVQAADGADEMLDELNRRQIPMGVVTNDSQDSAQSQLAKLGWLDYFTVVIGFDSGPKPKPHGDGVAAAAKASGCRASRAMMVGDSQHDITAAKRAGAVAVLVGDDPHWATGYDYHITGLEQLVHLPVFKITG